MARKRIYEVLGEKSRAVLATGQLMIVDAMFVEPDARQTVQTLARDVGAAFHGIWLQADAENLLKRVAARRCDASDAILKVVRAQLQCDPGAFSGEWAAVDAGGTAAETVAGARAAIGAAMREFESPSE